MKSGLAGLPLHHAAQHNDMWNGGLIMLYVRVNAC